MLNAEATVINHVPTTYYHHQRSALCEHHIHSETYVILFHSLMILTILFYLHLACVAAQSSFKTPMLEMAMLGHVTHCFLFCLVLSCLPTTTIIDDTTVSYFPYFVLQASCIVDGLTVSFQHGPDGNIIFV